MKKIILPLVVAFMAISVASAQELSKNFIDVNYIEVTANAEKEVVPNRIYLRIFINEKDFKNQSLAQIEKSMLNKLQGMGIETTKDLSIKDIVSNFKQYWILKNDVVLSKEYQLLVREANLAGKVFLELEKIGISNVSIEKLDHSDMEKYRQEVKMDAIKKAKSNAKLLAESIGQYAGRAIHIVDQTNMYHPNNYMLQGRMAGINVKSNTIVDDAVSEPNIEFEKIKFESTVTVKFELR